jgi:hypothetical protein
MWLPLVPGHQQVVTESRHPHSVLVSADSRALYLVPSWKTTWQSPFWAARRSYEAAECNSALVELQDYVVHSCVGAGVVAGFDFSYALTEAAKVPCLINSADLEAGTEIVLHLGVAGSKMQKAATRPTAARPQAQLEKAKKPRC